MKKSSRIQLYESLADLRAVTGLKSSPKVDGIHVFPHTDLDKTITYMPPYRRGFYQMTLMYHYGSSKMNLDEANYEGLKSTLFFVAPQQVFSWVRDEEVKAYFIYFRSDFVNIPDEQLKQTFTYFDLYTPKVITLNQADEVRFRNYFLGLYDEQNNRRSRFRKEILRLKLNTLLYYCQELYEANFDIQSRESHPLSEQFKTFVNNHYIDKKTVNEYAELLHITPNHLSQTIKRETGKTAKSIIDHRILLEAKNLLRYSNLPVAEVAYQLGFDEPTHFGRLFKKYNQLSPAKFRLAYAAK